MPSNSNLISLSSFVYGQFTFIILYRKCNLQCRNQSSNRFARSSTSNLMLAPSLHSLEKSIALQNFCNFQQMRNFLGIICNETHRKQWRYSSAYRLRYCHIGRFSNFLTHWLVNACGCMGVSVFCICVCVWKFEIKETQTRRYSNFRMVSLNGWSASKEHIDGNKRHEVFKTLIRSVWLHTAVDSIHKFAPTLREILIFSKRECA